jgi:ABC-type transport system involved in multi-copper enzyme maturation permease subunit
MNAIIRYILITAVRDWLFIGILFSLLALVFLSLFLGSTALSEQSAMQLVFVSSSSRLLLVIGLVLFICFHIRRSFDNREIEFIISRPISRTTFLLTYFFSFSIVSFILILPLLATIYIIFFPEIEGYLLWSLSLYLELIIISCFSILASLILRSAVLSVLGCFAFYLVSRIMGFAISTIIIPSNLQNVSLNTSLELFLKILSSILPRLDQYAQSKWLVYNDFSMEVIPLILCQSIIYIFLIFVMSVFDFNKKEF